MSSKDTSRIVRYSRDKLPLGRTDWARVHALTDDEVMLAALSDPDVQPLTHEQLATMRRVSRVKVIRQRLGMTQAEFAEAFRSISTVERMAEGSPAGCCDFGVEGHRHDERLRHPHHIGERSRTT